MSFLAPFMLWGSLAAGVPIALHFFFRSRYKKVPWAAMQFLLTSIEQTSRRLRFQELLLLLMRVALLALLAMALARPSSLGLGGGSASDAVDAVLVLDTSYSMGARDGTVSRFDRAKSAALEVIDHLPPHSTVQVIGCADRVTHQGPHSPSNFEQARQMIREIQPSHLSSDLLPGLREATAVLKRANSTNKEVYVFSDMQKLAWDQQATAIADQCKEIAGLARIYLVRCGTSTPRNVAVIGIGPQSGIPHTGERAGFTVLLRNSGTEAVRDLTVTLEVDGRGRDRDSKPIPILGPGETRAVALTARLDRAGMRVLTATVQPDELEADNRFDQVIEVRDQVRVLIVDGSISESNPEKSASYYLTHALRPVGEGDSGSYHIQPQVVAPGQAVPALLGDKDVCVFVNVPLEGGKGLVPDFLDRLADFVREGHGFMIFSGSEVEAESYNDILFDRHGLLPMKLAASNRSDMNLRLDPATAEQQSFLSGFREEPLSRIGEVEVLQTTGIEEPAAKEKAAETNATQGRVELRFSNGRPALTSKRLGEGQILMMFTSADATWSDWPIRPTFVPFIHATLGNLLQQQSRNHNRQVGEPIRWQPPERFTSRAFALVAPDGTRKRLGAAEKLGDKLAVTAGDLTQAGIYRIEPAEKKVTETADVAKPDDEPEPASFAVVPDLRESEDLESLSDMQLNDRVGIKVIHVIAGADASAFSGAERLNREWTLWILGAVLLIALFEALLAWFCGRAW